MRAKRLLNFLKKILEDHKGDDIIELDVRKLTDVTDYLIICTARSTRHAKTLSEKLIEVGREKDIRPFGVEGQEQADWILLDFHEVIVHIMLPEVREFYSLEKLWTVSRPNRKEHAN